MPQEEKLELVDLEKLKNSDWGAIFKLLIDSNLITNQGIRIAGQGVLITKLDVLSRLYEKIDKVALTTYHTEKKVDTLLNKWEWKNKKTKR